MFHGRGSSPFDFFFMYSKFVRDSRILPLDEFSTGILRALNVAPAQLHSNSWAYIGGFQMLCLGLGLNATQPLFLHHYCTRRGKKVGWVSMVSQSKNRLLNLFSSLYKCFKETFFKVLVKGESHQYVYDGDVPKFPLYWTRSPTKYMLWPRLTFTTVDFLALGTLQQMPRQTSTGRLLGCYSANDKAGAVASKSFPFLRLALDFLI